jgi:hypothetical protein
MASVSLCRNPRGIHHSPDQTTVGRT